MVTKVRLIKFAKCTPDQVSKLVLHDILQKLLMVSRLLIKKMHTFLLFIIFLIVCFHIPFYYVSYFPLHFTALIKKCLYGV